VTKYKRNIFLFGGTLLLSLFLNQCRSGHAEIQGFSSVPSPSDNPFSDEKIDLGKKLFFDKQLSRDGSVSCATCHAPEFAFTDRKKISEGVAGGKTERNSPSLLNSAYLKTVMFDAHLSSLEMQVIVPIQEHVEMDMKMGDLIDRLRKVPEYQEAARKIFNRDFDAWVLTRSIAAFERSLISANSPFDRYYYKKDKNAISANAQRGWKIFSEKLYCTQCHPAPYFTNFKAESNGLYSDYSPDHGRFRIFHDTADMGKFKVPSLRNIELTFPYMHDGSMKSIDEIIAHYTKGGENHFNKSNIIKPFKLSNQEKLDLKAFLISLTDTSYMTDFR
jgi:cytochrome c peroxidase